MGDARVGDSAAIPVAFGLFDSYQIGQSEFLQDLP
jgi:hypothetical protein